MWEEIGFRESPYATRSLPPTSEGDELLVGREPELDKLVRALTFATTHPTIEGDNGVGKTSLVSVAGYRAKQARLSGQRAQLFLPLGEPFQLSAQISAETFQRKVFFAVAQAFIDQHSVLSEAGFHAPDVEDVRRWLNSPVIRGGGGNVSIAGFGVGAQKEVTTNGSSGFSEAGFATTVEGWLRECFPGTLAGGFICVIDNLELLGTSAAARAILEELRDTVLAQQGLRWVLCGARGIVRTSASSPRLEGRLSTPIEVPPINAEAAAEVVGRRVKAFATRDSAVAPVDPDGFRYLYEVLNANLRNSLKHAEDYSMDLAGNGASFASSGEKLEDLKRWLRDTADRYHSDSSDIKPKAWEVFEGLVVLDGQCSPGDYAEFGFTSAEAMRPHVRSLEQSNLVISERDDSDNRRKTIMLSPRGWLVRYRLNDYEPS